MVSKKQKAIGHFWGIAIALVFFGQLFVPTYVCAQESKQITVTGTVKDPGGELLIGVNVIIKGKNKGTVTNIDGQYSIVANSNDILQFRFIGYSAQEVKIDGKSVVNTTLKPDVTDLEEVVVVGYGEAKRANLLGSVATMTTKEIADIPMTSMTNLLEGRLAGVHVAPAQPTGNPGAQTRIKIRAETTFGLSGGGEKDPTPLYVIDGFDASQSDFDMLDPIEVESISVLKDASAAVYGSKGANGVILVKTKRGKEGKLKLSYSGSFGIMDATMHTEMLSAYDHARMINARNKDIPTYKPISESELEQMKGLDYNWLNDAWHASSMSKHNINVSGGTDKIKYFGGGTYQYAEGNFDGLGVGKFSYRLGLDLEIIEGLYAAITVNIDSRDYTRPYYSGAGANTQEDLFAELLQAPRWTPYKIGDKYVANNVSFNPFALFNSKSSRRTLNQGNNINMKLTYDFKSIKGLKAEAAYSQDRSNGYSKDYRVPYKLYVFSAIDTSSLFLLGNTVNQIINVENGDRISESYSYGKSYQFRTNLSYTNKFGAHSISSMILYEQSESEGLGFSAASEKMVIPNLPLQEAFDYLNADADGSMSESGRLGGVARVNYSYADKYLLEAAGRYEGTTKFSPSERMGFFPSVAIGWVLSEEDFMKNNLGFISFLKTRVSYGITGYSSVGNYEYTLAYGPSGNFLFGGSSPVGGLGVSRKTDVVSSGVSWEKSKMLNYGVDVRFLDGKLGVNIDVFRTHQTDILDQRASEFSLISGITTMPSENIGELKAWGYDAELSYNGTVGREFKWYAKAMFNFAANTIIKKPTPYKENDYRYPIGQSTIAMGREEGYADKGIIRSQEQLDAINREWNEKWGHDYKPFNKVAEVGMLYYQDIGRPGVSSKGEPQTVYEPDGIINEFNDKGYIQRVNDHFVWKNLLPSSISLGGSWKSLAFSALFTMSYGIENEVVDKLARQAPSASSNAPSFWKDFYSTENPNGKYPHPKFAGTNSYVSTFWMRDVKQLRLNSLNVSYNVPSKLSKLVGLPGVRVYFSGTNLWSPIQTHDYKEDAIARFNTYPLLRTFNFGLNVSL